MSIWSVAFSRHEPAILAYLKRRLRPEDAEDLCQETFARAIAAPNAPREESRAKAYLFRISHNLLVNHFRRRKLVRNECDLGDEAQIADLARAPECHGPEVRTHVEDLADRLSEHLRDMPPDHRLAFELGVLEKRPYAEIARMTGWSLSKVKGNVFRARHRLIRELRAYRA